MKYIKKYNESQNTLIHDDLKEFCQEGLIALIDEGFHVMLKKPHNKTGFIVKLFKYGGDRKLGFTWNEIEDYYIPFLHRLSNLYSIEPVITIELVYINGNGTTSNAGDAFYRREHIKIDELEDYSKEYEVITKDAPIKIGNVLVAVEG